MMNPPTTVPHSLVPVPYAPLDHAPLPDYHHAQAAAAAAVTASAALSQGRSPVEGTRAMTATPAGKKRKTSGVPGSRGVANLTPDQLAKKRANDREAQRAIRERTRSTIESLERRIRDLESQQPYQELQRMIVERDSALAECEQLKRRLGAVAGIVGGGGHPSLNELANLTAQQPPLPALTPHPHSYAPPTPTSYEGQAHLSHSGLPSPHPTSHATPSSHASPLASHGPANQTGEQTFRKWPTNDQQSPASANLTHYEHHDAHPPPHVHYHSNGERHGLSFLLDNPNQQSISPYRPPHRSERPDYARHTNIGADTCTLDKLLQDFHTSRRRMLKEGLPALEVIGPDLPSFKALLKIREDPNASPGGQGISAMIVQIIHKFPDIKGLPEQTAIVYVMFLLMRWLICPCRRCYDRLPEFLRPIPEQYDIPHPPWLDYLTWPNMRRRFLTESLGIKFDDFFVPYTKTLSMNWSLPPESIFLPPPPGETLISAPDEPILNPVFLAHIHKLENWTVGSLFKSTFPNLIDETVKIIARP